MKAKLMPIRVGEYGSQDMSDGGKWFRIVVLDTENGAMQNITVPQDLQESCKGLKFGDEISPVVEILSRQEKGGSKLRLVNLDAGKAS